MRQAASNHNLLSDSNGDNAASDYIPSEFEWILICCIRLVFLFIEEDYIMGYFGALRNLD